MLSPSAAQPGNEEPCKTVSECLTEERRALKNAAHKARQDLVKAKKLSSANWWTLSEEDQTLVTNFHSGQLDRIRNDCDRAFGVCDAESVGERAMLKKVAVHNLVAAVK